MSDLSAISEEKKEPGVAQALCWICKRDEANSGEHKTKRSDLLGVLGSPTQQKPFYYQDLERRDKAVKNLDAKILKTPIPIRDRGKSALTQPPDLSWQNTSDPRRTHP